MSGRARGAPGGGHGCEHLAELDYATVSKAVRARGDRWPCDECGRRRHGDGNWLCLECGHVGCGRAVRRHALAHSEAEEHALVMGVGDTSVYCYTCDAWVTGDNWRGEVGLLRQEVMFARKRDAGTFVTRAGTPRQRDDPEEDAVEEEAAVEEEVRAAVVPRGKRKGRGGKGAGRGVAGAAMRVLSERQQLRRLSDLARRSEELMRTQGRVGLRNLGNTCYINATLQALVHVPAFRTFFLDTPLGAFAMGDDSAQVAMSRPTRRSAAADDEEVSLSHEVHKLVRALWATDEPAGSKAAASPAAAEGATAGAASKGTGKGKGGGGKGKKVKKVRPRAAVSPMSMLHAVWKAVPLFRGYQQHDAQEFLRHLLDRVRGEHAERVARYVDEQAARQRRNRKRGRKTGRTARSAMPEHLRTDVTAAFQGVLRSDVCCSTCGSTFTKNDPFLDLSVTLPGHTGSESEEEDAEEEGSEEEEEEEASSEEEEGTSEEEEEASSEEEWAEGGDGGSAEEEGAVSLEACLDLFTAPEQLRSSERFECPRCKDRRPATKTLSLQRAPPVLCVHLKRFEWREHTRKKLCDAVTFPLRGLDVGPYLYTSAGKRPRHALYDLVGVVRHHGTSFGSGHYTAYGFNTAAAAWFHFNDTRIALVDEEEVRAVQAYMLVYARRGNGGERKRKRR